MTNMVHILPDHYEDSINIISSLINYMYIDLYSALYSSHAEQVFRHQQ